MDKYIYFLIFPLISEHGDVETQDDSGFLTSLTEYLKYFSPWAKSFNFTIFHWCNKFSITFSITHKEICRKIPYITSLKLDSPQNHQMLLPSQKSNGQKLKNTSNLVMENWENFQIFLPFCQHKEQVLLISLKNSHHTLVKIFSLFPDSILLYI